MREGFGLVVWGHFLFPLSTLQYIPVNTATQIEWKRLPLGFPDSEKTDK